MFYKVKELQGYKIRATDGDIGDLYEIYFDDYEWRVRYFVVDTGSWLPGRRVLISPASVTGIDRDDRAVMVKLTKDQVKNSPDITTDAPISRQHEAALSNYYGWPNYWAEGYPIRPGMLSPIGVPYGYVGAPMVPAVPPSESPETTVDREVRAVEEAHEEESHLRSGRDVAGYHIEATDGAIGHLDDYIIDDENWFIRYIVVDTGGWLSGRKVLVIPEWIESIHWPESRVYVNLTKAEVERSPEYVPADLITREYETRLFENYNRPKYWEDVNDVPGRETTRRDRTS